MNSNLTLVQLISEQPMPNLLPILRLRPKRLIHITTPKTRSQSDHLLRAAHAAGIKPEIELVQLSDMPGISEVFEEVNQLLIQMNEADESCVVNFTGGTKLMSIGAYAAALTQKVPSLYVDGADARFVDGNTSSKMRELFDDDWSFASISNQLQVHILGIAHGTERITRGRNWQVFLPLSQYLFENRDDEECMHQALVGQNGVI